MKSALTLVALSWTGLSSVHAEVLRWDDGPDETGWRPARQTARNPHPIVDRSPAPTPAPLLASQALLQPRGDNNRTLGYIAGVLSLSRTCLGSFHVSIWSNLEVVDCCPDRPTRSCDPTTACLGLSSLSRFSTIGRGTILCAYSSYTNCVKYTYVDAAITGYSLWWCGVVATTRNILREATESAPPRIGRTTEDPDETNPRTVTIISYPPPTSTNIEEPANVPAVGVIAGSVAGAVGVVLLLLSVLEIFLYRRRRPRPGNNGDQAGPVNGNTPELETKAPRPVSELEAKVHPQGKAAAPSPGQPADFGQVTPVAELPAEGTGWGRRSEV